MAPSDYPPESRAKLETELLRKLREAEKKYKIAAAKFKEIKQRYKDLSDSGSDGRVALERAAQIEIEALENFKNILKQFSDLILRGIKPP
ncbi:MAG: hypothetical protein JOZ22_19725 [Acidobacteriia bacterium]|nr:hypothetical protein [Terriglobia bacterium]